MNDLPPLEFDLTPTEKERCGVFTAWLMKQRRKANQEADHRRQQEVLRSVLFADEIGRRP